MAKLSQGQQQSMHVCSWSCRLGQGETWQYWIRSRRMAVSCSSWDNRDDAEGHAMLPSTTRQR